MAAPGVSPSVDYFFFWQFSDFLFGKKTLWIAEFGRFLVHFQEDFRVGLVESEQRGDQTEDIFFSFRE